jgi:hypothetical protein
MPCVSQDFWITIASSFSAVVVTFPTFFFTVFYGVSYAFLGTKNALVKNDAGDAQFSRREADALKPFNESPIRGIPLHTSARGTLQK